MYCSVRGTTPLIEHSSVRYLSFFMIAVLTLEEKEMRTERQDTTSRSVHPSLSVSTVLLGCSLSLCVTCKFQVISYKLKPLYVHNFAILMIQSHSRIVLYSDWEYGAPKVIT